jgi:hypothetical protein
VGAVCGAKGVVDIDVAALCQLLGKLGVVLLLLWVPPGARRAKHGRGGKGWSAVSCVQWGLVLQGAASAGKESADPLKSPTPSC